MARYIDADKVMEALRADYDREGANAYEMAKKGLADASVKYGHGQFCYLNAMERVKDTPTADVVPKSEVANILDELMKQAGEIAESCKKEADGMSCSELMRTEYRGTQIGALIVQYKIAELKKKYTEGEG